ncbi:MAG: hypothetical protein J7M21_04990, partial [Planctomycetes bacterium]|nr:hypothetical protein [Planctomycetota bacterium]
ADRRRQAAKTAGVLAMMTAAVLLAWLGGRVVRSRLEASWRSGRSRLAGPSGPKVQSTSAPADLRSLLAAPLATAGLVELAGEPGGIPPPPSARRLQGFQRTLTDAIEQQAWYEVDASAEEVLRYYADELASRGFSRPRRLREPTGREVAIFQKGRTWATVAIPENTRQARVVIIVLTVVAPVMHESGRKR